MNKPMKRASPPSADSPWLLTRASLIVVVAAVLTACSSTPLRFYTLVTPAEPVTAPAAEGPLFDLLPVSVPAQVDVPQLRFRDGPTELRLLEAHQWAAPLPEEIRDAIALRLGERFGARDVRRQPGAAGAEVAQIRVDVQRFDVAAGGQVQVEALWTVLRGTDAQRCQSRILRPAGRTPEDWVIGYQSALAEIADGIGTVLTAAGTCP